MGLVTLFLYPTLCRIQLSRVSLRFNNNVKNLTHRIDCLFHYCRKTRHGQIVCAPNEQRSSKSTRNATSERDVESAVILMV